MYETIYNEPIHPSVSKKEILFKFKILKIEPFKKNEDPNKHLRWFKYSSYVIPNDNALMLHIFHMTLVGKPMDWYNNLIEYSICSYV